MVMHVVLVGPEFEENLSLRYLASALQAAGHSASLARFDSPEYTEGVVAQILREQPQLVGLSLVFQVRAREFFTLTRALRQAGYTGHITAGGHFATFAYEQILTELPQLDSIVRQEGENTLVALADTLEHLADGNQLAQIPGLVVRSADGAPLVAPPRQQVANLDTLPFPVRDALPESHLGVKTAFMVGSRGCYADCEYCSIFAWHEAALGKRYRMRSIANIAEEMDWLYSERGVRFFVFHDDNFFLPKAEGNRKRFEALHAELQRRGLHDIGLMLKLRPNDCDRQNMLLLKEMGLLRAFVGIENASQRQLRSLGRDSTVEDVNACLQMLRELDIYATYNILLFDPYTTLDDIAVNLSFLRSNPHFPFNWCKVEPYAGTELEKRYGREGRLRGDYLGYDYTMDDARVRALYDLLLPAFYYRNYDYYGLANLNIGLGYHRQLLKHFYPQYATHALCTRVQKLMEGVNHNTLDLLERAYQFIRTADLKDMAALQQFGEELKRSSFQAQHLYSGQMETVLQEIERAVGVRQQGPLGVSEAFTPLLPPPVETEAPVKSGRKRRTGIEEGSVGELLNTLRALLASWVAIRKQHTPESIPVSTPVHMERRQGLLALGGGLIWLLAGCHSSSQPSPSALPVVAPGSAPQATLRVAPGHSAQVAAWDAFVLEGILQPEDAVIVGEPRVIASEGSIVRVEKSRTSHRLQIVYHPSGGSTYRDPNVSISVAWTVRGKDSDVTIMTRAFVHVNDDGSYAFGYQTPRPTIAEMAAPPISSPTPPGG